MVRFRVFFALILVVIGLFGCEKKARQATETGFLIQSTDSGYKLTVKYHDLNFYYFLSRDSVKKAINVPVRRIVVFSTTHIGFLSELQGLDKIVGIAGKRYVSNEKIRQNLAVKDLGSADSPDLEKIVSLKPQVVFVFTIDQMLKLRRLAKYDIVVVPVFEYLETDPIKRLDWIKVFAVFLDRLDEAKKLVDSIASEYYSLRSSVKSYLAAAQVNRPKILVNLPYRGVWYVPGGRSYMARFIVDAGGYYYWAETKSTLSLPLSFEQVYTVAKNADVLINPLIARSISEILSIDSRLSDFKAIKTGNVYNNIKMADSSSNAFWEIGVVRPNWILSDLIKIFYPQAAIGYDSLYFYKKLN